MKRFKYLTLAAIVAFAACDEGGTPTPDEGSITGVVTIEGAGASGVTVALSSGASTTTDGSGQYSFSNVAAGSYTVTISGYPADATFGSTSQAAAITAAGQVVTVNFSGTYIRTSAILGGVTAGGTALSGVNVSIGSQSTTTDAGGQYSFSGLRAGSYTVTISGYDATKYAFATTSQPVTLAAGEAKVVSFSGQYQTNAKVSGRLFLDEGLRNNTLDTSEDILMAANIGITLETSPGNAVATETAADGSFMFENLTAGTYKVSINSTDADIPGNVAFNGTVDQLVTVTAGGNATVNWPFIITQQAIDVYGFLGTDGVAPGVAPIANWTLELYDTEANATNGNINVGGLGSVKTDAMGRSRFRFARSKDVGPGGPVDNIVFARWTSAIPADHVANGEKIIEIKYNPQDSIAMAPDTFDAIRNRVIVGFKADEIDGDPAASWFVALRSNKDSTSATTASTLTAANGMAYYNMTLATSATAGSDGILPDTFWIRLSSAQAAANGHGWKSTQMADEGSAAGRYLRFIWNGTVAASDTVMFGTETVTYTDADIIYRAHHEADDSTGVTPTYTMGDDFTEVGNVSVKILNEDGTVAKAAAALTAAGAPASMGPGSDRKYNLATGKNYTAVATSGWALLNVLTDTAVVFTLDGGNQIDTLDVLKGGAGASTFAYKMDNGTVSGAVTARDGTAAQGVKVRVQAGPGNIQGTQDTTVVAGALGTFTTNNNLREGPYTVTVMDSTTAGGTVWGFSVTLKTTSVPLASGSANNADAHSGVRDLQGNNATTTANFLPDRMDTKIQGVIANDRDADTNTIDPDEALANVEVNLYKDNSGTPTVSADSLVGTTTTDAGGAFAFSNLLEGRYIVKPTQPGANALVLRGLSNGDTAIVVTAAGYAASAITNGNPDATIGVAGTNGRIVGITTGFGVNPLPAWNYSNSTFNLKAVPFGHRQPHFTFLFNNGQATGTVTKTGVAVAGMTISAVKCSAASGYTSPPTIPIGGGTCTPTGSPFNVATDASGTFTFTGLQEGVWLLTANPATAGLPDAIMTGMFVILGNNDVETGNFVFP